jgi:hypothetical protein
METVSIFTVTEQAPASMGMEAAQKRRGGKAGNSSTLSGL